MVEYAEFEDLMASQMEDPLGADDLKYYFKKFDQSGDGFITGDELALVMKTFGGKTYSKEEIDDAIKTADINADGKVSYEGTLLLIMRECFKGMALFCYFHLWHVSDELWRNSVGSKRMRLHEHFLR